jgi:hypothetical protein
LSKHLFLNQLVTGALGYFGISLIPITVKILFIKTQNLDLMNGTNSTQFFTKIRMALLVMVLFTANLTQMGAQGVPSCACKGSIQVSLEENCQAVITTFDLLASPGTCGGFGSRMITLMKTKTGGIIVGPTVGSVILNDGGLYVGKTIYGKVSDGSGQNSCWTEIKIEDKMKPRWASSDPDVCIVTCPSLGTFVPRAIDNCHTPRVYQVSENIVVNNCLMPQIFAGPDTLKRITREYRAVDESGNVSDEICTVVIYVTAIDDIIWPKNTQLYCEEDYAKIPSGPFAGNPSPLDIGTKRGSGVPSLYPWLPTIKNGTYWIGRSTDGLRDSVSLTTNIVSPGTTASAQVCLTAPADITLNVNYGAARLPSVNDSIFYTINGAWVAGGKGGSVPPTLPLAIPLQKNKTICVNLVGSDTYLRFSLDTLMTGIPLSPEIVNDCNIFVTYTDQKFPAIKCVTKILRRWTVMEWSCNSSIKTYDQLIEIIDNKGPEIKDLRNDVATTGGHACEAFYKLQKPRLVDNCSSDLKYNVTVYDENDNPISTILGIRVSDADRFVKLPLGCNTITYTSFDDCHNSDETTIEVRVEDNTPPVAVCKQNTVVSLTSTGSAWVPSSSFDNGSYDECGLAKVLVRRMDPATNCTPCKTPILPGFTYVGEYNNTHTGKAHHYYVSKHRATPRVAAKTAAAVGGYLVHLNNGPEKDWVHARYNDWNLAEDYLIGLRDAIGKGQFSWYSGVVGNYRNWEAGYPVDTIVNALNLANESIYVRAKYDNSKWINFDEDDCDADEYLYVVEIEDPCGFSEYVEFCCADAGQSRVMVVRAIDKSGNWNECMVNAHIQNKIPPRIVCPDNRTISCNDPFDVSRLRESFGWATAEGNCNTVNITTDSTVELTSCRIGRITRRFKAFYPGGTDTARCTQVIMVMGNSNFRPTSFPPNQLIEGCEDPEDDAFSPDVLGKPIITADNSCSLAGFKYEDEVYTFNNSQGEACFKILRKWKVIDWCKFAPNVYIDTKGTTTTADDEIKTYPTGNYTGEDITTASNVYDDRRNRINTWEHIQEIKVVDRVPPVIQCPPAKTVCTYEQNCVGGFIELSATASDVCTEQLRWSYRIDINNDGSFDPGSQYNKNNLGNSIDAKGNYPIGTHRIQYVFEDRCGNASTCEQLFTIKNCKAPTPYCLNGLSTTLMPVDTDNNGTPDIGMVPVWASDFDNGSFHVCPRYTVALSFEPITANTDGTPKVVPGRTYTCDSIRTSTRKDVRIYVAAIDPNGKVVLDDQNRVVQDYCSTFITVQDNFRVCGTAGRIVVNGSVMTENSVPVKDVSVSLEGSEKTMMTGNTGTYNFADVTSGGSYLVKPFKNDDHINGISTLDLVMIQRHILGIERLNSPYKLIAADVNNDKNISAADLTELRKLILGISDKFNSNNSWRFVDKDHKFTDANKAQSEIFPELYSLNNVNSNMKIDFLSIKVGDVNGNVKANATDNNTESRSSQNFALNTVNAAFVADQTIEVPVEVAEANSVSGFQFTVAFDAEKVSLEGIDGSIVGMTDNNFGFTHLGDGLLTVSYNKDKAMDMAAGDKIIKLTFKAKTNGTVAEVLNINSDITKAEAYTGSLDVMNVNFNVVSRVAESVVLHQNTPNPFKASTVIGFDLPKAMGATITIYDVTGKMLREYKDEYSKGFNSIEINKNELGSVGVMYYTLEAEGFKATKKMVVIE